MSPVFLLAAGAVANVVGTVGSFQAQRKASAAQARQEALASRRSRRQAIREFQIRRAQAVSTAEGTGAFGSSGMAGGIGSLSSQLGAESGFSSSMTQLSNIISRNLTRASTFGALAQVGGAAMNYGFANGATFGNIFNRQPAAAPVPAVQSGYINPGSRLPPVSITRPTPYRTQYTPI